MVNYKSEPVIDCLLSDLICDHDQTTNCDDCETYKKYVEMAKTKPRIQKLLVSQQRKEG